MKLRHVEFVLRRALAKRGVLGTLVAASRKMVAQFSRRSTPAKQFNPVHPFDTEFGTDTSGLITPEVLLDNQRRKSIHNTGYYATSPSQFLQAFARLEIDFRRFTFVDLGAGKGRMLLLASSFPFRRVLGVEFAPALQMVAQQNIALYQPSSRQCQDVECLLSDARDFAFPLEPLVIFMWHPFGGPVFERVMQNLDESLRRDPREVYVVYLKPEFGHVVERIPALHKLWEDPITMTEQDFNSYLYPDKSELCATYSTK